MIERELKPDRITNFLREFVQLRNMFDIQYMRILRAFTGTYRKANVRNQNFIFQHFFWLQEKESTIRDMTASNIVVQTVKIPLDMKCRLLIIEGRVQLQHFENYEEKTSPIE